MDTHYEYSNTLMNFWANYQNFCKSYTCTIMKFWLKNSLIYGTGARDIRQHWYVPRLHLRKGKACCSKILRLLHLGISSVTIGIFAFSDHNLSVVRRLIRCRRLRCCRRRKLFTLSSSSPEPLDQFQPNLVQSILGWRGFNFFFQMKGHDLLSGDYYEIAKIQYTRKIFLSRTNRPISTKLGTKLPWVKGSH